MNIKYSVLGMLVVLGIFIYMINRKTETQKQKNDVPSGIYASPSPALSDVEEVFSSANGINTSTYGLNTNSVLL